jgi:two-component system cell cycle sensor histidine kinase/response regulator CckA
MEHAPAFRQKVLVVDDEPAIRSYVREVLEDDGYVVAEAGSLEEAVLLLALDGISVALTDIVMPGASGLDLAHRISLGWPHVVVVLMSGQHLPNPGDLPPETRVLTKPFSSDLLVSVVADAVRQQRVVTPNQIGALWGE